MAFRNCHSSTAFLGICSAISIISISAGTGYAQDQCLDSIELVKRDIQGRIGAVVPAVQNMSDADFYKLENARSPFTEADRIVVINLASHLAVGKTAPTKIQGLAAENIMASPLLTRTYAKQIIEACKSVASVKFFYWEWFQGWSLHKGKMLKADKCLEQNDPKRKEIFWGENICI
jgi:hypothetical protein